MTIPAILQVLQTVRSENPEAPQILQLHDDRSFSHDRRTLASEKRGALQILQILRSENPGIQQIPLILRSVNPKIPRSLQMGDGRRFSF